MNPFAITVRGILVSAMFSCGGVSTADEPAPKQIVVLIGETGYRTGETLPVFSKTHLEPAGFEVTFINVDPADEQRFALVSGGRKSPEQVQRSPEQVAETMRSADLLFMSVRRMALPQEQLQLIKDHLAAGKPLLAIRNSSHAFVLREDMPQAQQGVQWPGFDKEVLGGQYDRDSGIGGYDVTSQLRAEKHPLFAGVTLQPFHSEGTLYLMKDTAGVTQILRGIRVEDGQPTEMPVAWVRQHGNSRVFYTSLGVPTDFEQPGFNFVLRNAVYWCLGMDPPKDNAAGLAARDIFIEGLGVDADAEKMIREFVPTQGENGDASQPTPAVEAVKLFRTPDDIEVELVASEPDIAQPIHISFDARGRMWVVQYLQYPFPEGLKVVKYDQYLRAVYDKVPPPPPNHFVGKDKITVFEDTDGDGKYDSNKDVITGLNITTATVPVSNGVWVLNPPYLLFYPDANGDDVYDEAPEVHLSGFGLEDTHSVTNSLTWSPDGWLYGANGSTTTGLVSSEVTKNVRFLGQCIWRYHPGTKVFEIYAEGGGNTFSCEIDGVGRVFSGTNGGGTRGMYYPQGSYGVKGWAKHGPLTNPFAFGWFEHMRHEGDADRFPQAFLIYEGAALPERYNGAIIAANALHNRVWASEISPDGSTFKTKDMPPMVLTADRWFRPVDAKVGPDGAVYIADWYDSRLNHVDPRDNWHKASGRIYKIQASGGRKSPEQSERLKQVERPEPTDAALAQGANAPRSLDMCNLTDDDLLARFTHPNKWVRMTAVRLYGERLAKSGENARVCKLFRIMHPTANHPAALEALWACHLSGRFQKYPRHLTTMLKHPNENVRRWTVRLMGDEWHEDFDSDADDLADLARSEPSIHIRSQLACTAKRIETKYALPILRELLTHSEDAADPHIPMLLWWAIERHCGQPQLMRQFLEDDALWSLPIFEQIVITRLMQRYAMADFATTPAGQLAAPEAGQGSGLNKCAKLLEMAPTPIHRQLLMAGFLEAYQGRQIDGLPPELIQAIDEYQQSVGNSDLVLGLKLGKQESIAAAIKFIADEGADRPTRLVYIELLGQQHPASALGPLLGLLGSGNIAIKRAALQALLNFDDPSIGEAICSRYHSSLPDEQDLRSIAHRVLASRPAWAKRFLKEIDTSRIKKTNVTLDVVQQMRLHEDAEINQLLDKHWGKTRASSEEKKTQMARLRALLASGGRKPPELTERPNLTQRSKQTEPAEQTDAPRAQGANAPRSPDAPSPVRGKALFTKHCAVCHTLFSEGGQTGPNLTGYERDNIDFLLLSTVDPSAAIREEFTQFVIRNVDGQVFNGLIDKQDDRTVTLRGANNQTTLLNRADIEELKAVETSLMPDGLIEKMTDPELLDLFSYIRSKAPVQ